MVHSNSRRNDDHNKPYIFKAKLIMTFENALNNACFFGYFRFENQNMFKNTFFGVYVGFPTVGDKLRLIWIAVGRKISKFLIKTIKRQKTMLFKSKSGF